MLKKITTIRVESVAFGVAKMNNDTTKTNGDASDGVYGFIFRGYG